MFAGLKLAGLSPFGPIFEKELRATARRKRNYALRVLYLCGVLLAMLVAWSTTSNRVYVTSVAAQAQAQAEMGGMFFASFSMFSVLAMAAIGPVLTATAVSGERLGKTLHVLLMTPVTAWQIVAGKLFSRLLVALSLIGLSLPALALVRLLGGVELGRMLGVLCLCASTVMVTAAIGLLFSTFMNRAYAVILLAYAAILLLYAFVPFVLVMGFDFYGPPYMRMYQTINWLACALALAEPGSMATWTTWLPCVLAHLAFAGALLVASAAILRRTAQRAGESAPPAADPVVAGAPVVAGVPVVAADPVVAGVPVPIAPTSHPVLSPPAPRRPARDVSDLPVLWRELRRPLMTNPWQAAVGAAACVVLLLVTYLVLLSDGILDRDYSHAGYAWVFNLLVWLLVSVLSATAIAQEKESDTWTLLLTTPLSGRAIVWGKVLGLYRRLLWPALLIAAHFLLFTALGILHWPALLLTLWVIFSFNTIWVAVGVYLSLTYRKVTFAVILNLLLAVGIYLVAFLVLLVVGELTSDRDLAEFVGWYLPYHYLAVGITADWSRWDHEIFSLPQGSRVDGLVFLLTAAVIGALHLALSLGILHATARMFDRIVGRAPQAAAPGGH
jgi:ABC-type transport system involved in multi-copper enzyme maturation permease subunit